jgi:hypothetical protein
MVALTIVLLPWSSGQEFCQACYLEVTLTQILAYHTPLSTTCHVEFPIDISSPIFFWAFRSSPLSAKWTWTVSTFSTNESFYIIIVTDLQSCMWSGPYTWGWGLVTITVQALLLVEKVVLVQVCFMLRLRDQWSKWMQGRYMYRVYMDFDMASNGLCFMVTWTIFKHCLLKVGLTHDHDIMALQDLTTQFIIIY